MTMLSSILIGLSVFAVGLFCGLMFTLVFIMQMKWNRQTGSEYMTDIQPFLEVAKGHWVIQIVMFTVILAPIGAAIALDGTASAITPALIWAGTIIFMIGVFGVTIALNFPVYDAMMSMSAEQPSDEWPQLRQRFFALNLSRMIASGISFLAFITVLIV
ncbi:MAG: DUF1772 domain-containing protein [Chloroflexi bacterium]|nr:DUF1772 domain-containing protein [Chloroflexota bacterium]